MATRRVPLVPNKKKVIAAGLEASTENTRNSDKGGVDSCMIFCGCCRCHLQWVVEYSMVVLCLQSTIHSLSGCWFPTNTESTEKQRHCVQAVDGDMGSDASRLGRNLF